jgi:hypothetical protein
MAAINGIFKSVFSLLSISTISISRPVGTETVPPVKKQLLAQPLEEDAEKVFLASIAHLSEEEQQKQIERRMWYARMAERQAVYEAERYAEAYNRTGDRQYKF